MSTLRVFLLCAWSVVITIGTVRAESADDVDRSVSRVDALLAKYDRLDAPGCVVGIIQDGQLIYGKGFGSAHLDYQIPIAPQTSFAVASVTKSFTSVCVALLMDQGKLRPEDDIRNYLPEMHEFDPPITVGDLLRCHSGLRDYIHLMQLAGWPLEPGSVEYTSADLLQILSTQRTLQFPTGKKLGYSNSDYFLLGQIVERISGQSLSQFAKENLFEPLGMSRTSYLDRPADVLPNRAVGYVVNENGYDSWFSIGPIMGACGVYTTLEDLVRWDQNFYDNQLPEGDCVNAFFRDGELAGNRFCLDTDAYSKKIKPNRALGPPGQYRGLKRMQFTGGGWGSMAGIARYPEQRFTVICLANNEDVIPWLVAEDIAAMYLGDLMAPRAKPDEPAELAVGNGLGGSRFSAEDLQRNVGSFLDDTGRVWRVESREGELFLIHHRLGTFRLQPEGGGRFRPVDFPHENETIRFEPRSAAPRASLIYDWGHGSLEFKPFDLPVLTDEQLDGYAGNYDSDELQAMYRIAVVGSALRLQINNRAWEELMPTLADQFVPRIRHELDSRIFKFVRNQDRVVIAVEVDDGRALGVRLERGSQK